MKDYRLLHTWLVIVIALAAPLAFSGTIYVKTDAIGLADGSTWTDAFTDLQPAIDAATFGDEVWVAQGTYNPTSWPNGGSVARDRHFSLKNGVSVYGGFTGTETLLTERDYTTNITLLSGDFSADDVITGSGSALVITNNVENAFQVFYHPVGTNLDSSAGLDGVTVSGGNADGGISATDGGGGMDNTYSNPTIKNCTFTGNSAGNMGGAVRNTFSAPSFTNCTISLNLAATSGGGVQNTDSNAMFDRCTFSGNKVDSGGNWGGAMANDSSDTRCENSSIAGNYAPDGGGIYLDLSSPFFINCTFSLNEADFDGGGIVFVDAFPVLTNCTFNGNTADNGAAIFSGAGSVATIMNCTISGNTALSFGGGMDNANATSKPDITNSIFWGNVAASNPEISGGVPTVTSSLVQDGLNNPGDNPSLGPLQDNGGSVLTMAIDLSSPAYNTGTTPAGVPLTDARGYKRDASPDIGAFEYGGIQAFTVSFDVSAYGSITGDLSQTVFAGENALEVTAVPDTNFNFVNWTSGGTVYSTDNPLTVMTVVENMTITAVFAFKTHAFSSSAGTGGRILPQGTFNVVEGGTQIYTMVAEPGFAIANVLVDGVSVGNVSTYTFTNATENHTIRVNFKVISRDGNGGCALSGGTGGAVNLSLLALVSMILLVLSRLRRQHS